jgi:tetratricopeptide (TPR) repeat protein
LPEISLGNEAVHEEKESFEMDEATFTEFGELEDSSEAALKAAEDDGKSFEESFSDAVDAVFKVADNSGEKPAERVEPTLVKEELFEEENDFFDLAAELEEGLLNVQSAVEEDRPSDGQNYSIENILSDFKKGVDKQLGSEDYDTRYNLGIAYKEMGLIDEAIAEFQIAAKDPKRFLECCSMLGLCFVEKGMHKLAVKWYQRGLDSPGYSEEEYQGLRFDLAEAYESLGETDRALEVFQEVYGISANYRNVAKKVKELQEKKNQ